MALACASLALACSKSHGPGAGFMLSDPAGHAGSGASPGSTGAGGVFAGGAAGTGLVPGAGGSRPDPFFNCGGREIAVCNGNTVGICHDDGTYEARPCAPAASCLNSGTGARCVCPMGLAGDGFTCQDVNECANGTARCARSSQCGNTLGGYVCGACPAGYDDALGDGTVCRDIDECAVGNGGCDPLAACFNTQGSHVCGACPPGYVGLGGAYCAPGLLDLQVTPGELAPPFSSDNTYYTVYVPVLTETIAITATPVAGSVAIDGQTVDPGVAWTSPRLEPGGPSSFVVEVQEESSSLYTVAVWRDDMPQRLLPWDGNFESSFGRRVAVSGSEVAVSAPLAQSGGAVYVFGLDFESWYEQALLTGDAVQADDRFGGSLAFGDGVLAVGAAYDDSGAGDSGAVYVFERTHAGWQQQAYLKASNAGAGDQFGNSVALYGDTLVVGAPFEDGDGDALTDGGAVYVFVREAAGWAQRAYLKASNADAGDGFGAGVALHEGTLVVAAPLEDSSAPGVNGNGGDNGAQDSGAAYVFVGGGGSWMEQAYLKASNPGGGTDAGIDTGDQFGGGESLAGRGVAVFGDTIAVGAAGEDSSALGVNGAQNDEGAQDSGAVYVFVRSGTTWTQQAYLKPGHAVGSGSFGASLALWQEQLVIGAWQADGGGAGVRGDPNDGTIVSLSGAAYVFERVAGTWTQRFYLKAAPASENDYFGWSVAAARGVIAVGTGGPGFGAASAYVFR